MNRFLHQNDVDSLEEFKQFFLEIDYHFAKSTGFHQRMCGIDICRGEALEIAGDPHSRRVGNPEAIPAACGLPLGN